MSLEEFSKNLYEEMEVMTKDKDNCTFENARDISLQMLKLVTKLRDFMACYRFESKDEEIGFFRNVKPGFFSTLIFYRKIFEIQSATPVGMLPDLITYYLNELNNIKDYINSNKEFLSYYRSNSNVLDEIYFVRKEPDLWLSLQAEYEQNSFTTIYDQKLAKLLAYEQVSSFIIEEINNQQAGKKENDVTWTGSKAALIELLYAIQTSGSCNNGSIDVRQLASHFENLFNVKLGNFYRTFQEIRIRKMSRTTFLDQMKESLIKRMDNSDENPRF